jgi:hypothetical protein
MKKVVTQEDLDLNPALVEQGIEVGDEIEIPEPAEQEGEGQVGEDGPGPGAPPPPPTKP